MGSVPIIPIDMAADEPRIHADFDLVQEGENEVRPYCVV